METMPSEHVPLPLHHTEIAETLPLTTFETYRQVCDAEADSFRYLGLLEPAAYEAAVNDGRTWLANYKGANVPALVPIEYENGYDAERCRALTGKSDVLLLTLPPEALDVTSLTNNDGWQALGPDTAIVVETSGNKFYKQALPDALQGVGSFTAKEFYDPRIPAEESRAAAMELFVFSVAPPEQPNGAEVVSKSYWEGWQQHRVEQGIAAEPSADSNETYMYNAQSLRERPEVLDALWDISKHGFGSVLGEFHPVSMEEDRGFFDDHLLDEDSYTAVRFRDGKPVCFGTIAEGLTSSVWMNPASTSLHNVIQGANEHGESILSFSEIISNGDKGVMYSQDVLRTHYAAVAASNRKYKILFESTNLSATYVPKIAQRATRDSSMVQTEPIHRIDKLEYWYLAPAGLRHLTPVAEEQLSTNGEAPDRIS